MPTSCGRYCAWVLAIVVLGSILSGCNDDDNVAIGGGSGGDDSGSSSSGGDNGHQPPSEDAMLCADDASATKATTKTDVTTQSTDVDGKTIDVHMSVFWPELKKGQCAPVIIKSHGFGGSRVKNLADIEDDGDPTDVAARDAWRNGYFVISFDQRGFGQTGGKVRVEDPGYEGADIRAVLDYAEHDFGGHLAYRDGDPLVGALGYSYGGGFQLIGAAIDPRFDAIVPSATWYSLPYSLDPNGVPKTGWLDLLILLGATGSKTGLADYVYEGFAQAQTTGKVADDVIDELRGHGLNAFCSGMREDGKGVPDVAAFLVQGASDTLFNMNNAYRNAKCLRQAGNDVRVLIQRTGHILPLLQNKQNTLGFRLDKQVMCGDQSYSTAERMLGFLNEKLRDRTPKQPVARTCIVQNEDHGITTDEFPVGGKQYDIRTKKFTTGLVLSDVESVLEKVLNDGELLKNIADETGQTVDNLTGVINGLIHALLGSPTGLPDRLSDLLTGKVLGALPPSLLNELTNPKLKRKLFTVDHDMTIAGIPKADLKLSAPGDDSGLADPIVFVGLGVKRADDHDTGPKLMNQQVMPFRGSGEYKQNLVGVSRQLHQGDEVYLLVYGFDNQYYASFNRIPQQVRLTGDVELPLDPD